MVDPYPIGTPGTPWTDAERREWFTTRSIQRSYHDEVVSTIEALDPTFEVAQYGSLPLDPDRYPLFAITVRSPLPEAPWVLITGGVHGYETSGVQGALSFLERHGSSVRERANLLVAPCVSPWGYEVIDRWNPECIDPNRVFVPGSPSPEAAALMAMLDDVGVDVLMHMDLHETTDSDETQFRPALAARDGLELTPGEIPDGFYAVGDTDNPQPGFQAAIIAGVERVTHIAPPDRNGQIIETDITQHGVINYPIKDLGLCAGVTNATFTTTTEVYPDSPSATPEVCIDAQVAAVVAGLDFALTSVTTGVRPHH